MRRLMPANIETSVALDPKHRSYLRLVEISDAELICQLRNDEALGLHLGGNAFSIKDQEAWISRYKGRESAGLEYYFVIVSDGCDRGVVRMYDFKTIDGERSFCWGSWIIAPPRPAGLATFTALNMYEIGFDTLDFQRAHFDVRKLNERVNAFHLRAGAVRTGESELDYFYSYSRDAYKMFREASIAQLNHHREIINRASKSDSLDTALNP